MNEAQKQEAKQENPDTAVHSLCVPVPSSPSTFPFSNVKTNLAKLIHDFKIRTAVILEGTVTTRHRGPLGAMLYLSLKICQHVLFSEHLPT